MLRIVRVCGLPIDVSSSEPKPGKQQSKISNIFYTQQFLSCVLHSHIDRVCLQRSIAEMISVVLPHTVIALPNHVRPCHSVIVLHGVLGVSRHAVTTSDVCAYT